MMFVANSLKALPTSGGPLAASAVAGLQRRAVFRGDGAVSEGGGGFGVAGGGGVGGFKYSPLIFAEAHFL